MIITSTPPHDSLEQRKLNVIRQKKLFINKAYKTVAPRTGRLFPPSLMYIMLFIQRFTVHQA